MEANTEEMEVCSEASESPWERYCGGNYWSTEGPIYSRRALPTAKETDPGLW
jgi:hypothetical protein